MSLRTVKKLNKAILKTILLVLTSYFMPSLPFFEESIFAFCLVTIAKKTTEEDT